jgi:transmembrane sensor
MAEFARQRLADAREQAREWLVCLLDDTCSEDDLLALSEWLSEDPVNKEAFDEVERVWDLISAAPAARPSREDLKRDSYTPLLSVASWRRKRRGFGHRVWVAAACAAVVVGLTAISVGLISRHEPELQYATARAEMVLAHLPDGSDVHIAPMTRLNVLFSNRRRSLTLHQGEALFKVAKDPSRPFVVQTALADISAVGTAFDTTVGPDSVLLSVIEGVVKVEPPPKGRESVWAEGDGRAYRVAAGEKLVMRQENGRVFISQEKASEPTWIDGRLEYRNATLQAVIQDINRLGSRKIVLDDAVLGALSYTGTVQLDAVDAWALGLSRVFPIQAEATEQAIVLRQRNKISGTMGTAAPATKSPQKASSKLSGRS